MYRTQRLRYQLTPAVTASAPSVVPGPIGEEPVAAKKFRGSFESKVSSAYRSVTSHAPQPEFPVKGENGCRGSTVPFRTLFSPVSIQAPETNQPAASTSSRLLPPGPMRRRWLSTSRYSNLSAAGPTAHWRSPPYRVRSPFVVWAPNHVKRAFPLATVRPWGLVPGPSSPHMVSPSS